jgi:hypothetical protein
MWLHRRTGPNSAITYSAGAALIGLLVLGTFATKAWPAVLAIGFVVWLFVLRDRRQHSDFHEDDLDPNCRYCERELQELRAQERLEDDLADRDRLRARYRD